MEPRFRLYLGLLAALLALYAVAEAYRPPNLSWAHTYQNTDRIPFGTYALVDLLPELFATEEVTVVRAPVLNQIQECAPSSAVAGVVSKPLNYLFISPKLSLDSLDQARLLAFAAAGHHVFIAADNLPDVLLDTLGLIQRPIHAPTAPSRDTVRLFFAGDSTGRAYRFASDDLSGHFRQKGLAPNPALTTLAADAAGRAVLVRARRGFGDITVCSVPTAFTNYFVLRPATAGFAWQALSGLPPGPVWWDEYSKQGRAGSDSLLRVVLQHTALKMAFWLLLTGGGLLLFVHGRRRQRVIPVVAPLPNNTLQFVQTVAALYQQGDNHAIIVRRQIDLFLDHVRTRYRLPTDDLTADDFRAALALKTGLPRADLDELLRRLAGLRASSFVSDTDLLWLSEALSAARNR